MPRCLAWRYCSSLTKVIASRRPETLDSPAVDKQLKMVLKWFKLLRSTVLLTSPRSQFNFCMGTVCKKKKKLAPMISQLTYENKQKVRPSCECVFVNRC